MTEEPEITLEVVESEAESEPREPDMETIDEAIERLWRLVK